MSLVYFELPFRLFPTACDDDISDRLSHRWTVVLLISLGAVTMYATYVGDPIHCWCPAGFTDSHCNYTESYCWISDTYYIPENEYIPTELDNRREKEVKYYQWVPMILFFLALCFKTPNMVWGALNTKSGINIGRIVHNYDQSQIGEQRNEEIKTLIHNFIRWLEIKMHGGKGKLLINCGMVCGTKTRRYLTGLYLGIKVCYISVSVGMLFVLNKFLAMDYTVYGIEVISHLSNHADMSESPRFPRITLCDFEIRQLQNLHRYTVQCVLSINLFNEKIFAFLWFWFLLMTCVSTYSFLMWSVNILSPSKRINFVTKYIPKPETNFYIKDSDVKETYVKNPDVKETDVKDPESPGDISKDIRQMAQAKFVRDYLAVDGVFALRMLRYNTSDMVVYDLVNSLWDNWGVLK